MKRALFLLLLATSAYATDPLIVRIGASATALKTGDYAGALKIDERLIRDMLDRLGPGQEESKWFAVAVVHKAVALAGLGREDDAIWYWHVALNILPAIAETDMSMFGAPAVFLKQHPLQHPEIPLVAWNVKPPSTRTRVQPRYPLGMRTFGVTDIAIVIQAVIDKEGNVRDIEVKRAPPTATLTFAALEALRQWKFHPATIDGKAIDVAFNLTANFKLK
ncbi:MAG TPA: energy transducer TonB [Thermoanaerobaculia bacterium]